MQGRKEAPVLGGLAGPGTVVDAERAAAGLLLKDYGYYDRASVGFTK